MRLYWNIHRNHDSFRGLSSAETQHRFTDTSTYATLTELIAYPPLQNDQINSLENFKRRPRDEGACKRNVLTKFNIILINTNFNTVKQNNIVIWTRASASAMLRARIASPFTFVMAVRDLSPKYLVSIHFRWSILNKKWNLWQRSVTPDAPGELS